MEHHELLGQLSLLTRVCHIFLIMDLLPLVSLMPKNAATAWKHSVAFQQLWRIPGISTVAFQQLRRNQQFYSRRHRASGRWISFRLMSRSNAFSLVTPIFPEEKKGGIARYHWGGDVTNMAEAQLWTVEPCCVEILLDKLSTVQVFRRTCSGERKVEGFVIIDMASW